MLKTELNIRNFQVYIETRKPLVIVNLFIVTTFYECECYFRLSNINKFLGISIMGKIPRLSLVTQRICTSVEKDITTCTQKWEVYNGNKIEFFYSLSRMPIFHCRKQEMVTFVTLSTHLTLFSVFVGQYCITLFVFDGSLVFKFCLCIELYKKDSF